MESSIEVVLVDDEPAIHQIFNLYFEDDVESGLFRIFCYSDAEEFLKMIDESDFKKTYIVFSDINMPGKDGPELLEELKQRNIDFVFYFLSAYDDQAFIDHTVGSGAAGYLIKPILFGDLSKLIHKILDSRGARPPIV